MYDRGLGVLEKYGLTAKTVMRGRGALICETERGLVNIRECWGSPRKLELQRRLQLQCRESGYPWVDLVLENQEGQVITAGENQIPYVVRDWYLGRECDARSKTDIMEGVKAMADLHKALRMEKDDTADTVNLLEDYHKHNRELRRIRKFVQKKKKKNEFEELLAGSISLFLEQGEWVAAQMEQLGCEQMEKQQLAPVCHGDCNQHNILFVQGGIAFTNFERWHYGLQVSDLFLFMRKILEKHAWNTELGRFMVSNYNSRRQLPQEELLQLKLQLCYPWKYWKLANFYSGSNKVWISGKSTEKLKQAIALMEPWKKFQDDFCRF